MTRTIATVLALACLRATLWAVPAAQTQPAQEPPQGPRPVAAAKDDAPHEKPSPEAMKLLDRLEKAGREHKTVEATIDYLVEDMLTGDREQRTGWVAFRKGQKDDPDNFRVCFQTLKLGEGGSAKVQVDYAFDGQVLTVAKHRIKQMTRYSVAAPGEKVEAMKLGRGPFPLPFGQTVEDMLAFFKAETRPAGKSPAAEEPQDADYLLLTTRLDKRKQTNMDKAEMWIDRKTGLPVRIVSRENKTKKVTTLNFGEIKTNRELSAETFLLPKPPGWNLTVEKFEEGKALRP